ncbi:UDP-N-acetylmuramate--L-alanine ligase [Solirubrobacter phytolaccae]|uniref:UDP-N-acetylmuramate--L-alanine ligase n=1 Tax=Solirubrobacter phytolaccae TaxID=1404360 RepID=A0A9X3NCQ1_9ACTN|nr:cyanophycin synthetase [Solirubrobacter phytolaccae]MDA0182445.1 UDP-N-acetylmuramate--L-alanine ligase [Solirubrobacter phytolaccae]
MNQPWSGRKLHFVGIGGVGMSGLAKVARILGADVTGSDRSLDGHAAANVPEGAEVVYSSAIPPDNPERTTGAPELHRADLLAELTQLKPTIAVSGTHGKTTTSSMLVHALPGQSYLVGGEVRSTGTNADWNADSDWLIVEADESDRSLLKLHPTIAVVTNAELDHHTTYASSRDVDDTFAMFLARARDAVVAPDLTRLRADAHVFGEFDGELSVPGAHNRRNAGAALTAIELTGGDVQAAAGRLATFAGAGRRFEVVGTAHGATVVDDYAHHPTEVRATIEAARTQPASRVIALFQPHLFSRTQREATAFGKALANADLAILLDVYPAREEAADYPGVSGLTLVRSTLDARPGMPVFWARTHENARRFLQETLQNGDLLLTMGAGDVNTIGRDLVAHSEPPGR